MKIRIIIMWIIVTIVPFSQAFSASPFESLNQGLKDYGDSMMQMRQMQMQEQLMRAQQELLRSETALNQARVGQIRREAYANSFKQGYEKGYDQGYTKGIDEAVEYIQKIVPAAEATGVTKIGNMVLNEKSQEKLREYADIAKNELSREPNNSFHKVMLVLIQYRLKELAY